MGAYYQDSEHKSVNATGQRWLSMSALGQKRTSQHLRSMSALPPKADIGERDRQERRTVRFTLTGYANGMRAFSIYTAPIGIRLSVICWEYGQ